MHHWEIRSPLSSERNGLIGLVIFATIHVVEEFLQVVLLSVIVNYHCWLSSSGFSSRRH